MRCDGSMSSASWLDGRQVPILLHHEKGGEKFLPKCDHFHVNRSTVAPRAAKQKPPAAEARVRGVPRPCAAAARRESALRHAACGAAMHGACARHRMRPGIGAPSGGWRWLKLPPPAAKRKPPADYSGSGDALGYAGGAQPLRAEARGRGGP